MAAAAAAAQPPGPPGLGNGHPSVISNRDPNRPRESITAILNLQSCPTFFHVKKAWAILGFHNKARPNQRNLLNQVETLWRAIGEIDTRKSRRARAAILDALRTLGLRSPLWKANSRLLDILHVYPPTLPPPIANWPPDETRSWGRRRDPTMFLNEQARITLVFEHWAKRVVERSLWQDYHKYQGFSIADPAPGAAKDSKIYLRPIWVPKDSDSLWRSVGYWMLRRQNALRQDYGPDVSRPWAIKMQIWSYFKSVLKDPTHPRWCEYHMLENRSRTHHPEFGNLSLMRSLHASNRQGLPAFSHRYIFFVIAEFFGTQVVVFRVPDPPPAAAKSAGGAGGVGGAGGAGDGAIPAVTLQMHHRQGHDDYEAVVYGHRSCPDKPQILLAADLSGRFYDPVDFDYAPLHHKSGWSAARDGQTTPGPGWAPASTSAPSAPPARGGIQFPLGAGDFCQPRGPCDWWPGEALAAAHPDWVQRDLKQAWAALRGIPAARCPDDLARFNYVPRADRERLDAQLDASPPAHGEDGPHGVYDGRVRNLHGRLPHRFSPGKPELADCEITDDRFKCFRAGVDIAGDGFRLPADEVVDAWNFGRGGGGGPEDTAAAGPPGTVPTPDRNYEAAPPEKSEDEFQWRFGMKPDGVLAGDGLQLLDDPYLEFEDDPMMAM